MRVVPQSCRGNPVWSPVITRTHKSKRKKLKSAVEEEDFEEAARLRDLIAELSRKEGKNA